MSLTIKKRWIASSKCINSLYNEISCVLLNNCKCIMDYQVVKNRIKKHEGFRDTVYADSLGKFTENLGSLKKENSVSMLCGASVGKRGYDIRLKFGLIKIIYQPKLYFIHPRDGQYQMQNNYQMITK